MAEQTTLQDCSTRLYDLAKRWWVAANGFRVGVVIAGVAATLLGWAPLPASLVAGALALAAWFTQYRSDVVRDQANDLRRDIDLQDGLGWPISAMMLNDLSTQIGSFVSAERPEKSYCASVLPAGPRRLVENIRETGFFSEHLASTAAKIMWSATAVLCTLSVGGLFVTIATVDDIEVVRTVGVVLASVLLFVEAAGVARLALDYQGFRNAACETKTQADRLLATDAITDTEALQVAETYFIHRARAPLLPDWVYGGLRMLGVTLYRGRRDKLNALWERRYGVNSEAT
ncbi:MAG: hypothetical protein AAF624_00555 [Bacteroidota bacterium]